MHFEVALMKITYRNDYFLQESEQRDVPLDRIIKYK